jgi:hypothetical protein
MRAVYAIVFVVGFVALVAQHLTSPSSGRPVSPEDFAGACAPCGAPCPSVRRQGVSRDPKRTSASPKFSSRKL